MTSLATWPLCVAAYRSAYGPPAPLAQSANFLRRAAVTTASMSMQTAAKE